MLYFIAGRTSCNDMSKKKKREIKNVFIYSSFIHTQIDELYKNVILFTDEDFRKL